MVSTWVLIDFNQGQISAAYKSLPAGAIHFQTINPINLKYKYVLQAGKDARFSTLSGVTWKLMLVS